MNWEPCTRIRRDQTFRRAGILRGFLWCAALLLAAPAAEACYVNNIACYPAAKVPGLELEQVSTGYFTIRCSETCVADVTRSVGDAAMITTDLPAFVSGIDEEIRTYQASSGAKIGTTGITINWVCQPPGAPSPYSGSCAIPISVVLPPQPESSENKPSTAKTKDPVNTESGELVFYEPYDLYLDGPMPLYFQRYYASYLRRSFILGDLGNNWLHNFDHRLYWNGTTARYVSATGRVVVFLKEGTAWTQQNNLHTPYQVVIEAGSNPILYDPEADRFYTFDYSTGGGVTGKLVKVEDAKGNAHTLTYTAAGKLSTVSDNLGRTLTFTYNTATISKISKVSGGVSYAVAFRYEDPLDTENLTRFDNAMTLATYYAYADTTGTADRALLLSKTLPDGSIPTTQTYYGTADQYVSGRVKTQADANGNVHTFTYNTTTGTTTVQDPLGHTTQHVHTNGKLDSAANELGKTIAIGSDAAGRRTRVTDPLGANTTRTYHAASGKTASVTYPDGSTISYTYAIRIVRGVKLYPLTGIQYPDGTTETFTYDASLNLVSRRNRSGKTWLYSYNGRGQRETETNPAQGATFYSYDDHGNLATVRDHAGNTVQYAYDSLHRLTALTWFDGATRTFTYNALHRLTSTADANGTVTMTYDSAGRLATIKNGLNQATSFTYDGNGQILTITNPLGKRLTRAYDELGRLKTQTDALGRVVTLSYDAAGRLTGLTDPAEKAWSSTYDDNGETTGGSSPAGDTGAIAYDAAGNATGLTDATGHTTSFTYDADRRITSTTDPLGNRTAFTFDAEGRLTRMTLPGTTGEGSYTYNPLGLLTEATAAPNSHWLYTYDPQGRLTASADPLGHQTTYTYDGRNRIANVGYPGGGAQSISYNGVNRVTRRQFSDGTDLGYTYDGVGRMTAANHLVLGHDATGRITASNGLVTAYDDEGQITSLTIAPGKTITYGYDSRGLLTSVSDWVGGSTTFTYDAAGRLLSISRPNSVTTTYSYDPNGRMAGITEGSLASMTFTRDPNGLIVSANRILAQEPVIARDALTQLSFDAASRIQGRTYDAMGRLTGDSRRSYAWDLASRLTGYSEGDKIVTYDYDAFGGVYTRTEGGATRRFFWNYAFQGLPVISAIVENDSDRRYFVHTPEGTLLYSVEIGDNTRHFYHFDEAGNTVMLTNDQGVVTNRYAYTPYGTVMGSTGTFDNGFTYGGQFGVMAEGNGLYRMGQRLYDSTTMRFISPDPIPGRLHPHLINPYAYAAGNPLGFHDPLGMSPNEITPMKAVKEGTGSVLGVADIAEHYVSKAAEGAERTAEKLASLPITNPTTGDVRYVNRFAQRAKSLNSTAKPLKVMGALGNALQVVSVAEEAVRLKDAYDRVNAEYGQRVANAMAVFNASYLEALRLYKMKLWNETKLWDFARRIQRNLDAELEQAGIDRDTDSWLNFWVGIKNFACGFVPIPFLSDIISPEENYPGVH